MYRIPFNKPCILGDEIEYIADAIKRGHASGDGFYTKQCERKLEGQVGAARALLTTSGTHALEMAAFLLDLQPGDEVIMPSFTFVSTANAFVLRGAQPVFSDIRPDTLNIDTARVAELVTPSTKAIVVVHYGGVACDMDEILDISQQRNVPVIEDNAHGLFGTYKGKALGTFGALAAQSFHETKNFHCGEGGALLLNEEAYIARAEMIREKGTDRSRFHRGEVDKYTWRDVGSSYVPSDMLAAFLYAQLEQRDRIQSQRAQLWMRYAAELSAWADDHNVILPHVPSHCCHTHHVFQLIMPSEGARDRLVDHLKSQSILSVFHYLPLHLSEMGKRFGGAEGDCPVTEDYSRRLVRLPLYHDLRLDEQAVVIAAVKKSL